MSLLHERFLDLGWSFLTIPRQLCDYRAFATSIAVSSAGISSLLHSFSREFNSKLRHYAIVFQHPSLPRQVSGNRKTKNVSMANLLCAAPQETARRLLSHDGCQAIFLRESDTI